MLPPPSDSGQQSALASSAITDLSPELIELYDSHVVIDRIGQYAIKPGSSLPADHQKTLQQILDNTNQEYRTALAELPDFARHKGHEVYGSGGGVTFHWWGKTIWLNNLNSYRLSALLAGGAAIGTVATFIASVTGVGAVIAGAFAAVLTVATAGSLICNWNGRGINIHLPNIGGAWCTPR